MSNTDERAAFEAWYAKRYWPDTKDWQGGFSDPAHREHIEERWEAWQTRAALSAAPAAPVLYVSPEQALAHRDPDEDDASGRYIPARKTPKGKFTMALYAAPPPQPAAIVAAAREWWSERTINDWGEADLARAVIRLEGDWPGCDECDHQCGEPCMPATVDEQLRAVDERIAQLVYEGALPTPTDYKPPEGWKPARPSPGSKRAVTLRLERELSRVPDGCHKLDTDRQAFFYEQDFYVLSNFSSFNLEWDGMTFQTSEAAYHWEKFAVEHDDDTRNSIAYAIYEAPSAHAAFKIAEANRLLRRADWDDVKVGIMRNILRAKAAQHEYVRRKLLATGDRELVEDSWRDDFWGWGPDRKGQNMLGKLWMEVRAELRAAPTPGSPA